VIGEPLTVAPSVLRAPILRCLVLVSAAKLGRDLTVAAAKLAWA
jgi:membrane protein YqaA with SNARE-associated domain